MSDAPVIGLFVGGQGSRMGGVAKGNLKAPDSELSLLERLVLECRAAAPAADIVLVGEAAAYTSLGLTAVDDRPPGIGPLGGLAGLLEYAATRGAPFALALACDLPRLERALVARLLSADESAHVALVRQNDVRNPVIARYAVAPAQNAVAAALSTGRRSLQAVLDHLEPSVLALALSPSESALLDDWDTPSDIRRG